MWAMIGSAITMPVAFLIGSKWGTTGIAAAWLAAYPIMITPVYHRVFQKTGITAREYLGILLPSINASIIMSLVLFGIRSVIPAKMSPLLALLALMIGGSLAYGTALFAFYRQRVSHLMRTIRSMLGGR